MTVVALLWGILAILGMLLGFIPCLGAFNGLNIPVSAVGALVSLFATARAKPTSRGTAIVGLVLCLVAMTFGMFRLKLGGGVF